MIDGNGQLAIGAAVMLLVQVSKTMMPKEMAKSAAPYLALVFSLLATVVYVISMPMFPPSRLDIWALFMGWLMVFATATGVYQGAKLSGLVGKGEAK